MTRLTLFMMLLGSFFSYAQQTITLNSNIPFSKLYPLSQEELIFESSLSNFKLQTVHASAGNFVRINGDKLIANSEVGTAELPSYHELLEIPTGADYSFEIISHVEEIVDLNQYGGDKIFPMQASLSKSQSPEEYVFIKNEQFYATNSFTEDELISIVNKGTMRKSTVGNLKISPFQYNPVTNELKVTTKLVVKVIFKNVDYNQMAMNQKVYHSPTFGSALNKLTNHESLSLLEKDAIVTYPTKYVIVADPMFQTALESFVAWKTLKGFNVIEAYTNDPLVGNTTTSIKSYLANLYNSATVDDPAPSYVLLVGDVGQIPSFQGTEGDHLADLYYCEYDGGSDFIPDAYCGRFSANNVGELTPQIDKTIEYEKYLFPDDSFLDNVVLISGVDASMAPTYGNGQINYGTDNYFNSAHGINEFVWLYPESDGPVEQDIMNQISAGCSFLNYTAHGSPDGFVDPSIDVSDVASFTNNHMYPTMIGNCCQTNTFSITTCFGESLLRAANKGAIGYIGGSNVTYWNEDFWWGVGHEPISANPTYNVGNYGAYDCNFHENGEAYEDWYVTQAQLMFAGNLAVTASGSGFTKYYWEVYHLMGDPSLMTYITTAENMTVVHNTTEVVGISSLNVQAEPYAYVAVSQNGVLLDAQYTQSGSTVNLSFESVITIDPLDVVVTKQNRKPYFGQVTLVSPTNTPYIVLNSSNHDDSPSNGNNKVDYNELINLDVELKNIGDLTGNNISAVLTTASTSVSIIDNNQSWGNITAGSMEEILASFTYQVNDNIVDQEQVTFLLTITDSDGNTWTANIYVTLNAPNVSVLALTVNDATGNNNGRLDPGETVTLQITAKNTGHADLLLAQGDISTNSTYLTIDTGNDAIGTMGVNQIVTGSYTITVSESTPFGTIVDITNVVGLNFYDDSKTFDLPVGLMSEDFETNDFTLYPWTSQSPVSWFTTNTDPYEGDYCSQSGAIGDNSETNMMITLNVSVAGDVSFMKKISTEASYDYLEFYIDGNLQDKWAGESDWSPSSYAVSTGTHVLKWAYVKDASVAGGSDAVWVDDILFPPLVNSASITTNTITNGNLVYPNPFQSEVHVKIDDSNLGHKARITVRDIQGRVVYEDIIAELNEDLLIELNTLTNGFYTLSVATNTMTLNQVLVKE
jgi:hypothetical protein